MEFSTIVFVAIIALLLYLVLKPESSSKRLLTASSNIPAEVLARHIDELRELLVTGDAADNLSTNLIMKRGEYLIFDVPNITLCEERTVRTTGSTRSVRVRVMKGVSVGLGGFDASPVTKVVPIDTGNLTVTNKRLHFAGESKTVDTTLTRINTIEELDDGISISRSGKTKIEYFLGTDALSLKLKIEPRRGETFEPEEVTYYLNGEECKAIIIEAISRLD